MVLRKGGLRVREAGPADPPIRPGSCSLSTDGEQYFDKYRPTDIPALFQIFADAPATAGGMRDFYNKFGPLEFGSDKFGGDAPQPGWCKYQLGVAEPLAHHARLRRAIELFERGDLSALSKGFGGRWGKLNIELRPRAANRVTMALIPFSLIHFLWLQLAEYAGGDAKLFRCAQCGHPVLIGSQNSPRRSRKAKYCSSVCRLAAFRERHASAQPIK
jgi:hypothetical protein